MTIDGHPAVHVTGTPRPGFSCAAGGIGLFWDGNVSDPWSIAPGIALSVWVTQVRSDVWLFWYRGDQVTAADESAVISSIRFITALPTP